MTGYGKLKFSDGKKYEGWWYNNNQHGIGKTIEESLKYCLWENGKKIL